MAVTTVAQFAAELNRPAGTLLEQLQSAGVAKKSPDDALTETDKQRLLEHLRNAHGTNSADRKKITLTRKSTSEIKQADASGKARTIQVQVVKKRTFVKRDDLPTSAPVAEAPAEEDDLQRREEEARARAEALRAQEEAIAREAVERAERERAEREAAESAARAEAEARAAAEAKAAADAAEAAARAEAAAALEKAAGRTPAAAPAPAAEAPKPGEPAKPAEPTKPAEPPKPALRIVKAGEAEAAEKLRLSELEKRRKKAEDEAAAIRAMMSGPKRGVLIAKKPEEAKPAAAAPGISGTIHKPKVAPGATPASTTAAKLGDKKSVKSEKLSSSWADDAAKKRAAAGKGRTDGGGGNRPGWRAPRGGAGGRRGERDGGGGNFQAPTEQVIQEVHVPETISVADLAHKMSVKAAEVIKQLMKLGQMVTINQQLDQETAMIVVEEMGHKAFPAKLDDPDAFLAEEHSARRRIARHRAPAPEHARSLDGSGLSEPVGFLARPRNHEVERGSRWFRLETAPIQTVCRQRLRGPHDCLAPQLITRSYPPVRSEVGLILLARPVHPSRLAATHSESAKGSSTFFIDVFSLQKCA